jgi:transcriptional regulator with XRE-family HTH domain
MTNAQFAEHVGDITISYASYLRSGNRLPSGEVLVRIVKVFKLDPGAAMTAYQEGREAFGTYLRRNVFGDPDDAPVAE